MSLYELTLVLTEAAAKDEKKAIALVPGKIKTTTVWGVRDLAYPIKQAVKGGYFFFELELDSGESTHLAKALKQNDQVLRFLLIRAKE